MSSEQKALDVVNKVEAWYKSKPLYFGAVVGFIVGQILHFWLHI